MCWVMTVASEASYCSPQIRKKMAFYNPDLGNNGFMFLFMLDCHHTRNDIQLYNLENK